jgi:hypothetical protein
MPNGPRTNKIAKPVPTQMIRCPLWPMADKLKFAKSTPNQQICRPPPKTQRVDQQRTTENATPMLTKHQEFIAQRHEHNALANHCSGSCCSIALPQLTS